MNETGILEFIALFVAIAAGTIVYFTIKNGISPMPTSRKVARVVEQTVKRLPQHGEIVDAGSGWGQLALRLARLDSNRKVIGLENSWVPLWISRLGKIIMVSPNVTFYRKNLHHYDYSNAGVIVCYLCTGAMKRLDERFRRQLAPGTWIVSIAFALPSWEPEEVMTCSDLHRTKIYIYCS